jgi:hypothetical protein
MRILGIVALALLLSVALGAPAQADCDIGKFDQSAPDAIRSKVNTGVVQFEWATDVDTVNGYEWIWHYIKNTHPDRGLSYRWPKADLRRALGSPLEAGSTDCNRYFVAVPTAPDGEAPITYGTNESVQRAAVFAPSKNAAAASPQPPPSTGSIIETSYRNAAGGTENVRVALWTGEEKGTDKGWSLQIEQTQNATVLIANISKYFSVEQLRSLQSQFARQLVSIDIIDIRKLTGRDDKEALEGLYSENELADRSGQPYLFLPPGKATVSLPTPTLLPLSTDLILVDRQRHPFFATTVRLLVPSNPR